MIAGVDGATIPSFVEPISTIEKAIQGYKIPVITADQMKAARQAIDNPQPAPVQDPNDPGTQIFAMIQHTHGGGHNSQHPQRPNPPAHQPRRPEQPRHTPRHSGRNYHQRYRSGDIHIYGGHPCVAYGGIWFFPYGGVAWPEWFFGGDVYFVEVNGQWYVVSYDQPDLMFQVVVYAN